MNHQARDPRRRYRARLLLTTCWVAALGITSRAVPVGALIWDKYVGDVVYAAVFYLALSLIWVAAPRRAKVALTAVYVVAIEAFQLTQIPARLYHSERWVVRAFAYVVLGSTFSGWDLLAYAVGIAGIVWLDRRCLDVESASSSLPIV
jgi:hypothetical protein